MISVICDRALLGAYTLDRHRVTSALVRHAATEVFGKRFAPQWLPWAVTAGIAVVLTAATVALWNFQHWNVHAAAGEAPATLADPPAAPAARPHADKCGRPAAAAAAAPTWRSCRRSTPRKLTPTVPSLFVRPWGAKYQQDPCTQASQQGLECITERGSFGQLRLYNHPAILLLTDAAGASHQVVLSALGDEQASLQIGGTHAVAIGELTRYWLGDFVMLWHPANSPVKTLSAGMRGADVRWLRQSLQRLHGAPADAPASDVFDGELTALVRDFQREHQLSVDGIAGVPVEAPSQRHCRGWRALLSATETPHGG